MVVQWAYTLVGPRQVCVCGRMHVWGREGFGAFYIFICVDSHCRRGNEAWLDLDTNDVVMHRLLAIREVLRVAMPASRCRTRNTLHMVLSKRQCIVH